MPVKRPAHIIRGFYPIIDTAYVRPAELEETALKIISGGARIIQLRAKGVGSGELLRAARVLRSLTRDNNVTFIVNDRVDAAILSRADGVHLGQKDIPVEDARALLGGRAMIGLSTHSLEEALEAQLTSADYISFGPVFKTGTKTDAEPPKGLDALKEVKQRSRKPVVAIGGITEGLLHDVLKTGVDSVAMISEVLKAKDITSKVSSIVKRIEGNFL